MKPPTNRPKKQGEFELNGGFWIRRERKMCSDMGDLNAWQERTELLYRYPISPCVCYEIHVLYYQFHTEILNAKASLYIVGEGFDKKENEIFFKRECLLENETVLDCLNKAIEYYEEFKNKESED